MAEREVYTLMDTGDKSFKAGNYSEAIALYTQAIECNSSSDSIDYSKRAAAYLYLSLADTDSHIKESMPYSWGNFNPEVARAYYRKACFLEGMEKYQDALAEAEQALVYDVNNTQYSGKITWLKSQNEKQLLKVNESMVAGSSNLLECEVDLPWLKQLDIPQSEWARLYAIWDIESLKVLRGYDINRVIPSIVQWLDSLRYQGVFEIEAVVAKYTRDRIPDEVRVALEAKGDRFSAVGKTGRNVADTEIAKRLRTWAKNCRKENCQKGLAVVFTCDGHYGFVLKRIQSCDIHTRIVYLPQSLRKKVRNYRTTAGNHVWDEVFSVKAKSDRSLTRVSGEPVCSAIPNIIWAGMTEQGKTDWSVGRGREVSYWPALTRIIKGSRAVYRVKVKGSIKTKKWKTRA